MSEKLHALVKPLGLATAAERYTRDREHRGPGRARSTARARITFAEDWSWRRSGKDPAALTVAVDLWTALTLTEVVLRSSFDLVPALFYESFGSFSIFGVLAACLYAAEIRNPPIVDLEEVLCILAVVRVSCLSVLFSSCTVFARSFRLVLHVLLLQAQGL